MQTWLAEESKAVVRWVTLRHSVTHLMHPRSRHESTTWAETVVTCTKLSAMDPVQAGNACGRDANHRDSCSRCYKAAMPVAGARSMLLRC